MEQTRKNNPTRSQGGFTLIEIIAVLVILGILAAVAVPRFVDLQEEAREKAASATFGALQSAASMNFAKGALTPTDHTPITNMTILVGLLDVEPDGWSVSGNVLNNDDSSLAITLTTSEVTGASRAELTKNW